MSLAAIARLALPPGTKARLIGMLGAYGDDSEERDIVVVAMCVAPDRQWTRFLPEWAAALRRHHLATFHMETFVRRASDYRGWPEGDYERHLVRLASIIGNRTTIRVGVAVDTHK